MDQRLAGESGNGRNGYGAKTVLTDSGRIDLSIPRDRQATFDPQLIAQCQRRFPGLNDKIVSMYGKRCSEPFWRSVHSSVQPGWRPTPWHEFVNAALGPTVDEAGEQVGEIGVRVDAMELARLDQRCEGGPVCAALVTARE